MIKGQVTSLTPEEKQTIGKALGRVPSGVFIVTTRLEGAASAMMASWVQQVSFEPPAVSIAIGKDRPMLQAIRASGKLAISVVGQDDSHLMKKYARGIAPGQDPFEGIHTLETPAGMPALRDSLAWLDCKLLKILDINTDHDMVIAQITAGAQLKEGPAFTHQRGNGFHY